MAPPAAAVPPPLPPSIEESYRRKCIQLKSRMNEVEEANAAAALRLARMHRSIEKMRLERAFLLEQLAKRTSTNVEDSEGSPSPPPTPKEKPLRTKRGHRKPSFLTNLDAGPSFATTSILAQEAARGSGSPSSQGPTNSVPPASLPNQVEDSAKAKQESSELSSLQPTNGVGRVDSTSATHRSEPGKKLPKNAFELYANDMRSKFIATNGEAYAAGDSDPNTDLARAWTALSEEEKSEWEEKLKDKDSVRGPAGIGKDETSQSNGTRGSHQEIPQNNEDVEMADNDESEVPDDQ